MESCYDDEYLSGVASFAVTLPTMFLLLEWNTIMATSSQLIMCYIINGVFFHCQTISAYYLMDYISPGEIVTNHNSELTPHMYFDQQEFIFQ